MKKTPILILHGWKIGMTTKRYEPLTTLLKKSGFTVFAPDLPGFGSEPLRKPALNLDDYVDFIVSFLDKHHIKQVVLIGHSFGGRIAAKFAMLYPHRVEKLVLSGSPLIRERLRGRKRLANRIATAVKPVTMFIPKPLFLVFRKALYRFIGEWDYYQAGTLKETFKNIIQDDLSTLLPKITLPVLLVWGERDTFVPKSLAKRIQLLLPNAILHVIPNATHRLPYEQPHEFFEAIKRFL